MTKGPDCPYSRSLVPNFDAQWVPFAKRGPMPEPGFMASIVLKDLSFHTDPNRTLDDLAAIVEWACTKPGFILAYQDEFVRDVVPYMVLSELAPVLQQARANGRVSLPVARVLDTLNIGVELPETTRESLKARNDLWGMRVHCREDLSPGSEHGQTAEEITGQATVAEINKWLWQLDTPRKLKEEAEYYLGAAIGEVLGNAARHAKPQTKKLDGDWRVAAFMGKRNDGEGGSPVLHCYLGFLNEGAPFAESLQTANAETLAKLDAYKASCLSQNCAQSPETLATVFALQDGITRMAGINREGAGGLGLMHILRFVRALGATDQEPFLPRITIVSGRSCVQIRDHHLANLSPALPNGDDDILDNLWFNAQNTMDLPPDPQYAFELTRNFPGTALTIDFILDERFL